MKRPTILNFLLLAAGLVIYSSVSRAQTKTQPKPAVARISGQVRYADGPAGPAGVMIVLEGERPGVVEQTQTDSQGKFVFTQIPQAAYIITARQPGFREISQRVDLRAVPTSFVVLSLQPIPREQEPPEKSTPGAIVSAEELSAPQGAKKELENGRRLLLDYKKPSESIVFFRKAIKIAPTYSQAHFLLGTAYMDLGQWRDAEEALSKAVKLNAKLGLAYLALGSCLNQQQKFAEAEKPLRRGLELSPEAAEGNYELGRAYWALGRWQEAEPYARKALALRKEFPTAHLLLGNILLRKREPAAALEEFKEYLRLEPNGPFAAPTRAIVAKIEKALGNAR